MENLKLSNQICFPIYSASRLITKAYKPYLDELGLTYPQYLVLLVLWENDEVTINHISKELQLNTNTLSPLLKRMEKMELIHRNRSSKDERSVLIQLSKKGNNMKAEAILIPEKLRSLLIAEDISLTEIVEMKNTLEQLIHLLSKKTPNN